MTKSFLVHYILYILPQQYGSFKISYNTHKDKWSINELLNMCVQEEGRLIMELGESAFMETQKKTRIKPNRKGKARYLLKLKARRNPSVSSVRRRDT